MAFLGVAMAFLGVCNSQLRRRTFFFPVFRTAATESMSRNLGLPKNAEGQGLKPLRVSQIGYGAWPLR